MICWVCLVFGFACNPTKKLPSGTRKVETSEPSSSSPKTPGWSSTGQNTCVHQLIDVVWSRRICLQKEMYSYVQSSHHFWEGKLAFILKLRSWRDEGMLPWKWVGRWKSSSWYGKFIPLFTTGFYTSQVVVWDFWTINSSNKGQPCRKNLWWYPPWLPEIEQLAPENWWLEDLFPFGIAYL